MAADFSGVLRTVQYRFTLRTMVHHAQLSP